MRQREMKQRHGARKQGRERAVGVREMNCMCVLERQKKKMWGRHRNSFHSQFAEAQSGSTQSSSLEDYQGCFLPALLLRLDV